MHVQQPGSGQAKPRTASSTPRRSTCLIYDFGVGPVLASFIEQPHERCACGMSGAQSADLGGRVRRAGETAEVGWEQGSQGAGLNSLPAAPAPPRITQLVQPRTRALPLRGAPAIGATHLYTGSCPGGHAASCPDLRSPRSPAMHCSSCLHLALPRTAAADLHKPAWSALPTRCIAVDPTLHGPALPCPASHSVVLPCTCHAALSNVAELTGPGVLVNSPCMPKPFAAHSPHAHLARQQRRLRACGRGRATGRSVGRSGRQAGRHGWHRCAMRLPSVPGGLRDGPCDAP